MPTLVLQVPAELRFLLPLARRGGTVPILAAGTDTVGHVVQAAGIPLTEVSSLAMDGVPVRSWARAVDGVLDLTPVVRPQRPPTSPPRFLLDVHLGGLARRLRLLGLDAAYHADADDAALVEQAAVEERVLLSQDRGLLRRRAVLAGALVRGAGTAAQLDDVLDRFAPPLAPWTRCMSCNGLLGPVSLQEVATQLEPGTRFTYRDFARCAECGRVYWRGAHAARLERVVARAKDVVHSRLVSSGAAVAQPLCELAFPADGLVTDTCSPRQDG
ncbi:MAG TPA: Mut7-C RNAse domain-containing protein [Propionibacteriaceae bacterium]|nr:Mut7-C RNAse domain-containing protein [Propionibacteriaceae bacterium]